jgi:hypothetical protein
MSAVFGIVPSIEMVIFAGRAVAGRRGLRHAVVNFSYFSEASRLVA